jgi:antitoxin component YwqK of YwqJK toxin-antitoxin module
MYSEKFLTLQKISLNFLLIIHFGCSAFISEQNINDTALKTSYYPNGSIEYESEYKNGILHGVSKYWDNSGNLISEAKYSNGKLHGLWISYFSNGRIHSKVNYYYGKKDGDEKSFYDNGQLKSLTSYKEGEVVFEKIRWTKAGNLIP